MSNPNWNDIRQFYLDNFGIAVDLVDLLADSDILTMCASGSSNESIAISTDIGINDVKKVLLSIYNFSGWSVDLDINPLGIYEELYSTTFKSGHNLYKLFSDECLKLKPRTSIDTKTMFRICQICKKIEERIEIEWV